MSDDGRPWRRELDELRGVRDALRVQAHLGGMEARDLWEDLEARFEAVEVRAKRLAHASPGSLDGLERTLDQALAELREGYARLRDRVAADAVPGRVWDHIRYRLDRLVDEGFRATEHVVDGLEEFGDAARLRVEKARLERELLQKCARLGTRVFDLVKQPVLPDGTPPPILGDKEVEALLRDVGSLDARLQTVGRKVAEHGS